MPETTGMDTILSAVETVTTLVGGVFDIIVSNPLLIVFVAASVLGVGIGIFQQLKGAAQ